MEEYLSKDNKTLVKQTMACSTVGWQGRPLKQH